MRVFIAIDIPEDIRQRLTALQQELRTATDSARWVPAESVHLTLKFLGEISEKRLDLVDQALSSLTWKPFQVAVRGVGFFPGARSPRVFWAGLEAPVLEGLTREIDARMQRLGFDSEKRAFRAHITLARSRHTRLDRELVSRAAPFETQDFGAFLVDRCFLYRSTLKPAGAVYERLREYILQPASIIRGG